MISKELLDIIDWIVNKLNQNYIESLDKNKEIILASSVKLSEEVWELSWEILKSIGRARKEKLENFSKDSLNWEFADVILSLLVFAKTMNIDINEALEYKLKKIKDRWWV